MKKLLIALLVSFAFQVNAQDVAQTVTAQRFRIGVQGGFSRLLAKTSDAVPTEFRDHVSALKSGYHYGADVSYFIKPTWGLGVKFNQFRSSNSIMVYDEMMIPQGEAKTTLVNSFIGPSFATKYDSPNSKHVFLFNVAIGYMAYLSDTDAMRVKTTGGTVGSAIDAGYDYRIIKHFALGAQVSLVGGVLSKLTYERGNMSVTETLPDGQKESMTRLDFSLGARFNF
ncbi:outer membrane beta-barrel protein [Pedobacter xixiisoli]|uniref:Outer membrane protein beta-barrel domain-containing protein n=1 Tax=Pedobacter xixiisoli TaxID=1476464 RepID=A0A286AD77_9SPHI|nr:outer membrane beta-barrel protein [Pedobacter xixiisoli]SOD19862.1 Outer membrane protein beta-barrel domain-containing protein [Pedobacter xixiisoli]